MRTEVRRGRKFVEYTDNSLPKGTFVQDISVADVSYQDEAGKWNPLDESWETDGLDGFSFRASRMNHKVRFDSIGAWRWYPRRNVETEYIVINRPKCWLTRTNRWGNLLVNGISREGRDITLTSLRNVTRVIHSSWNGIKTDWILENDKSPTHYRQKIDLVGITEKDGVLYGEDGMGLARLMPTTATDANGKELPCEGKYADGYLDFSVDTSGAEYPVTLDPDFAGATGDGYVRGRSTDYFDARNYSFDFDTGTNYIKIGQDYEDSEYFVYRGFLKFDTSSIPDSNTIGQVNLKLVCIADSSYTDFDVQIVKQNWSSQDPLSDDNRETAYDNCLSGTADNSIWRNTSGMSTDTQYASGNLDTSWVNKTGSTYYSLRSSRDKNNNTPTGFESIYIASADHATSSYRPVLTVTYSTAYTLTCAAGSYALTGTSATLEVKHNYALTCNAGSYALTGTAASFVLHRNFTLSLASGSYALTGTNANLVLQRNYVLACGVGSYALTGSACAFTVLRNYTLACNSGGYAVTGADALFEVQRNYVLPLDSGSYVLTGTDTTFVLQRNYTLACGAGSYALAGSACTFTVLRNYTLACNSGSYAVTGTPASLILQRNYTASLTGGSYALTGTPVTFPITRFYALTCEAGNYTLTGTDIAITSQYVVSIGSGSYSLNGTDAVITRGYTLTSDAGNYAVTGTDVTVTSQHVMALGSGSYSLTGTDVLLIEAGKISCEAGSYILTGTDTSITRGYELSLDAGSYAIAGTDITFEVQRNYAVTLGSGIYTLDGVDIGISKSLIISCVSGSYALTGTPADIAFARTLTLGTGSYALTGTNAELFKGLVLPCFPGSYALVGSDITVNAAYIFALDIGSYVLIGMPCALFIITETPACRTYTIPYEDRTLEVTCH